MKFVTFSNKHKEERLGFIVNGNILDLKKHAEMAGMRLPSTMTEMLSDWQVYLERARELEKQCLDSKISALNEDMETITLLACVPKPSSLRDGYAFRQHVATARRNRGVEMIEEFDQYPIFYFSNHNAVVGSGDLVLEKDHLEKFDFELEAAVVLAKHGKNIDAKDADSYVAGYMIMNDFSARTLQMEEMKLNLGPAKGKDFATALGAILVTPDELEAHKVPAPSGHVGNTYDLKMKAYHNGELISEGSMKDMNWTFAEIIERVSYGVEVYPGDVIGSGTVGTGCYLELNGTRMLEAKESGGSYKPVWLEPGDEIELEMTGLGKLKNKIVLSKNDVSILAKKKTKVAS